MKQIFVLVFLSCFFQTLLAQNPQVIKTLSIQKNLVKDPAHPDTNLYKLYVVVELGDNAPFSNITCNVSAIDSTSHLYITKQFNTTAQGTFSDGSSCLRDANFLYLCLGSYVLNKPIVLEAILTNTNDQRVGYLATKE